MTGQGLEGLGQDWILWIPSLWTVKHDRGGAWSTPRILGEVDRGKKEGALGTTGSLSSLFPLPSVPRALSFTLSPASKLPTRPSAKEASAEERGCKLTVTWVTPTNKDSGTF